ncbi:hypothetical protein AQ1_00774 [alpha proteobacterium Q-1]|nr:hypothetical protein AQ1_00774 [alpha proteobacterium Q-1]
MNGQTDHGETACHAQSPPKQDERCLSAPSISAGDAYFKEKALDGKLVIMLRCNNNARKL